MTSISFKTARKYPIGIQTFSRVIKENYLYVDKTDLVWQLAHYAKYICTVEEFYERNKKYNTGTKGLNSQEKEKILLSLPDDHFIKKPFIKIP